MNIKPSMFIASSTESLDFAYALQTALSRQVECTVWNQDTFELSQSTWDSLIQKAKTSDFAAFICAADDITITRKEERHVARDNIIFELGLFAGQLGIERCFILTPDLQEGKRVSLPSDLLGLTVTQYESNRQDGNIQAGIAPAATQIRKAIEKRGFIQTKTKSDSSDIKNH